ncbi:hypothetical protein ACNKHN_21740 [Shigella flexneri]
MLFSAHLFLRLPADQRAGISASDVGRAARNLVAGVAFCGLLLRRLTTSPTKPAYANALLMVPRCPLFTMNRVETNLTWAIPDGYRVKCCTSSCTTAFCCSG